MGGIITVIWVVFSILAIHVLGRLMRQRQAALSGMLRTCVDEQLEWAKQRARSIRAIRAAKKRKKAADERGPLKPVRAEGKSSEQVEETAAAPGIW